MTTTNEELLGKFVHTGMIMRHIDGEGPKCRKHRHALPAPCFTATLS